jgi:hypothetical protein
MNGFASKLGLLGRQPRWQVFIAVLVTLGFSWSWIANPASAQIPAKICSRTSVGFLPLMDMTASDSYQGEEGGLYGDGVNALPGNHPHMVKAYEATLDIQPRNSSGAVDLVNGRIGFISIGMSNAKAEFGKFQENVGAEKSPAIVIVNGAQPGKVASVWANPTPGDDPWAFLADKVTAAGLSPAQVQAVWLKQANADPDAEDDAFPVYAQKLRDDMGTIVRRVRTDYPNVGVVYFSSRIYAGYADILLSPEPFAYEGGFSVRWLIQDQIAGGGASGVTYDNSPVLLWGPYLWADGMTPRSDGLVWTCDDFESDGIHPEDSARQKVAEMIKDFFTGDSLAKTWYTGSGTPTPPPSPTPTPPPVNYDEMFFLPMMEK